MDKQDTFCSLPWIHACIRTDNKVRPCCRYKGDTDVQFDNVETQGKTAFDSSYFTKLRQDMLKGVRRSECVKCWTEELNPNPHKKSMRQFLNHRFRHAITSETATDQFANVYYIEMGLDNICNLECRMCDSKFSSKLQKRDRYLNKRVNKKLEPSWSKFDNTDLDHLEYVKVLGGEVFISPNFEPFIDWLDQRRGVENITLELATNGSSIPQGTLLDKLQRFKFLYINVSLDSTDKANNYQRQGSNYNTILENYTRLDSVFARKHLSIHSTQSVLTAHTLATTLTDLDKLNYPYTVDFVIDPDHLNIQCATPEYKQWIIESNRSNSVALNMINNHLKIDKYSKQVWEDLEFHVTRLDDYYNVQLADYNPTLAEHLGV